MGYPQCVSCASARPATGIYSHPNNAMLTTWLRRVVVAVAGAAVIALLCPLPLLILIH
jgi:hypothetical protein